MKQVKNFNLDFYEFVSVNNFVKDAPNPKKIYQMDCRNISSVKSQVDAKKSIYE